VEYVSVSNGFGYLTPQPGLGLPAGSFFYNRLGVYVGASSKWKRNLTLTYGVRYAREPGRSDSQFPPIPQLNALIPGLGNRVRDPETNFAPQVGFAWNISGRGRTSIRGGIGLFYENVLTVVASPDPEYRTAMGDVFQQAPTACASTGTPQPVAIPGSHLPLPTFCGTSSSPVAIGTVANEIVAFQQQYQAASPFSLTTPNPNYVGALLDKGLGSFSYLYDPNYRTPRSVEMNIGIEREIRPGMILSADFLRNVQTHYFLETDENHAGDVRYFNKAAAIQAINNTLAACGVVSVQAGIGAPCPSGNYLDASGNPRPLLIADFAGAWLTSSADFGAACTSAPPICLGYACAFSGINPNAPPLLFLKPIGRSVYDGLQAKLTGNVPHPLAGVRALNLQVSYAL